MVLCAGAEKDLTLAHDLCPAQDPTDGGGLGQMIGDGVEIEGGEQSEYLLVCSGP